METRRELDNIKRQVAAIFTLEQEFLGNRSRRQPYPAARFSVFWSLRQFGYSGAEISRVCHYSQHAVSHGIDRFLDMKTTGCDRCRQVEQAIEKMRAGD